MSRENLREELEHLHAELHRAGNLDSATLETLADISADIQRLLDQRGPARPAEHQPLKNRIESELTRLEGTHPTLTAALNRVADALTQMGI